MHRTYVGCKNKEVSMEHNPVCPFIKISPEYVREVSYRHGLKPTKE